MAEMFSVVGEAIYDGDSDTLIPLQRKGFDDAIAAAFWWGYMWAHGIDHLDEDQVEDAERSLERFRARWAGYEEEYLAAEMNRGLGDG